MRLVLILVGLVFSCMSVAEQPVVSASRKISSSEGGFTGVIEDGNMFGSSVCRVGDVDGDGVSDLAIGQALDDDGATDAGAIWILFMDSAGSVTGHQKISASAGGFDGDLDERDAFGSSLAPIGDFDGNGVPDIAVGAVGDDDGGFSRGAIWLVLLEDDGTVASASKISDTEGDFDGGLGSRGQFGCAVANLGDHDGNGVVDLAVGAYQDSDGGIGAGAIWILFLAADGTVMDHQKIRRWVSDVAVLNYEHTGVSADAWTGDFAGGGQFGVSIAALGDLDGDGVGDLAVGALSEDDGPIDAGAVWILFLAEDGTVTDHQKISTSAGGFDGSLGAYDFFGAAIASFKHGVIVVGAPGDDEGGPNHGALWILGLRSSGAVDKHRKINSLQGGLDVDLDPGDQLGRALTPVGDLDGDGFPDLAASAVLDDDGGPDRGAVHLLFMGREFLRGDVDGNGVVAAMADALFLLRYTFLLDLAPPCFDAADVDDSGTVEGLVDALYLIQYGFLGGPSPPKPGFEACGADPSNDALTCITETCASP